MANGWIRTGAGGTAVARDEAVPIRRYTETAMWFHWATALLMFAIVPIAWVMTSLPDGSPEAGPLYSLHKSLGITVVAIVAARLCWRLAHPAPRLPDATAGDRAVRAVAGTSHLLLYAVLLAMPVSGYLLTATGSHPLGWFGVPLPKLGSHPALHRIAGEIHLLGQWAVYALVTLHVAGAFWHAMVARDGLFERMLPARRAG